MSVEDGNEVVCLRCSKEFMFSRGDVGWDVADAGLAWIESYLTKRFQFITVGKVRLMCVILMFHKDPFRFRNLFHFTSIDNVITLLVVNFHQYADDTQFYIALNRSNVDTQTSGLRRMFARGS